DYVKFLRFGQWRIALTGQGVLAFITDHSYLDSPTFRGMRQQLMNAFTDIYILDLHGGARKRERAPGGGPDSNVFDIQQGVAIGIFVKEPAKSGPAAVHHAEAWGTREHKYASLAANDIASTSWTTLAPQAPFYLFVPQDVTLSAEYERGWKLTEAMPVNALGFQTHRDHFAIDFDRNDLRARIAALRDTRMSDDELRKTYGLKDNRDWQLPRARAQLRGDPAWERHLIRCLYRPFDWRWCYFNNAAMDFPRTELQQHLLSPNLALLCSRQQATVGFQHAWMASVPPNDCVTSTTSREANQAFPLYLYPSQQEIASGLYRADERRANLASSFVAALSQRLGFAYLAEGGGDLQATFGPEDVLHYIYAILHSPAYRSRYAAFMKIDFPRIPLTSDVALFRTLVQKGAELVALHLLESPKLAQPITHYPVPGPNVVAPGYPRYLAPGDPEPGSGKPLAAGRVYISGDEPTQGTRGQYFEGVAPEVWDFYVGGYQVCEKWLKDRRGRQLSHADLTQYERIVVALAETIRLMREIDEAIEAHGGWPLR
ncbi:MAG: DNA methyltransferase, partial [Chloroflexi bacterium]|nr:DNA methyltransferase [Chloroflexota bacterium]